ncbi:hypothetical protein BUE80_DR011580 [Diplocarpon rosae]|nr:hypothetical protein BUE80_DR011580 [Diplocarpon rosae]
MASDGANPLAENALRPVVTSNIDEKTKISQLGEVSTFDAVQTKKLLRKLDWHLVPFLSLLYLLSFLDRTNIGNAKLFGLEASLGLEGLQYNTALWLVTNFRGLVIARVFLGATESGLFPGVNYYITLWYPRKECAFRAAVFFSAATVAGAFGGLLARAINEMSGVGGRPGWAWIFILEGILTVLIAMVAFFVMADNPETATFLTPEETKEVHLRLKQDNDSLAHHFDTKFMMDALTDWKIWMQSVAYIGVLVPLYSFSLFLPSIIRAMGYSDAMSQLLTVPPYVLGCIVTVLGGFYSDKLNKRGVLLVGFTFHAMVGYVLLLSTETPAVQYIGTFMAACGVYPSVPIMVMWNGNNIGGSTKRGVGIAMQIGFGNCGGIISSFMHVDRRSVCVVL